MVAAAIRPDAWDFPLLVHVFGAMVLVGALTLSATALFLAWRDGSVSLVRLGYRSLLVGALPAWIVMRAGAAWIADKEGLTNSDLAWIGMGFTTADFGIAFLVVSTALAGFAVRRGGRAEDSGGGLGGAAMVLVGLLLVAYLVTVWAMTTKPA